MLPRLALLFAIATITAAQPAPQFDAISIKPVQAADTSGHPPIRVLPGGRLEAYTSLRSLVMYAYDLRDYQISEGPSWTTSDPYNVTATGAPGANPSDAEVWSMMKSMLATRFAMTAKLQKKEMSLYLLEVLRAGPKFSESAADARFMLNVSVGRLDASKMPMDRLAISLAVSLHQPVLNRTGLNGAYDIHLRAAEAGMTPRNPAQGDDSAPSIFSALPDQLGLTLRPSKEAIEFLQIEHMEKPTAN